MLAIYMTQDDTSQAIPCNNGTDGMQWCNTAKKGGMT